MALEAAEEARRLFDYDPDTGVLTRRVRSGRAGAGSAAGTPNDRGYLRVAVRGRSYKVHRVIFLMMTGAWPPEYIDHINGDPSDNRWRNLRPATNAENQRNRTRNRDNTIGAKGVRWHRNKFNARICANGTQHYLGSFDTVEEAAAAYREAALRLHGDFARVE